MTKHTKSVTMPYMVITPQVLWKDFDRKLLPLNEVVVSARKLSNATEQSLYFNGEPLASGCTRVFARLVTPDPRPGTAEVTAGAKTTPLLADKAFTRAVIIMGEPQTDISKVDVSGLVEQGYAALLLDYAGNFGNRARFTIYPAALSFANFTSDDTLVQSAEIPTKTCWYVWAVTALRGIALLEKLGYEKKVMVGVGTGSAQVWKTAIFDDTLTAGLSVFSALPKIRPVSEQGDGNYLNYKASLDTPSYAPILKAPIMEIITSNDRTGSLDRMNDIFNAITRDDCRLSVEPRTNRSISSNQHTNILKWLRYYLNGEGTIPPKPHVLATVSEHALYYEIKIDTTVKPVSVSLYVAQSTLSSAYRNWRFYKAERVSDTEWISKAEVYLPKEPIYAFASVTYESGFTLSSDVIMRIPALLGVNPTSFVKKRLIYDSDMGGDDWLSLGKDKSRQTLEMREGPFGIRGIALLSGNLSTFKLGDVVYRGTADNVLQLILYSDTVQTITFKVTDSAFGQLREYECTREISPNDDWAKFSLSANDFKSDVGTLQSWENVVIFELESENTVLINSLLWV